MKSYRIENRSRSKFRFQALAKDGSRDSSADIVIGDAQDSDELIESKGIERGPKCPAPVVTVTEAQLAKLAPSSRVEYAALSSGPRPRTGPWSTGTWPPLVVTELGA